MHTYSEFYTVLHIIRHTNFYKEHVRRKNYGLKVKGRPRGKIIEAVMVGYIVLKRGNLD